VAAEALVCARQRPLQFPLRPYSIVDLCAGGSGSRRRGPGLYARADPAIPIAPLQILPFLVRKAV
jgi:hypothetical protein